jgi:hypothetical protein
VLDEAGIFFGRLIRRRQSPPIVAGCAPRGLPSPPAPAELQVLLNAI